MSDMPVRKRRKLHQLTITDNMYRTVERQRWQLIIEVVETGASYADIGKALHVPRQTARIRVRQAYRGLSLPMPEQSLEESES